jgi:hypothetical protein
MRKECCEEQTKSTFAAVAAINGVHDAKKELDGARRRELNTEPYDLALYDARTTEGFAVAALESHKKQHKCWGIHLPRPLPRRSTHLRCQTCSRVGYPVDFSDMKDQP